MDRHGAAPIDQTHRGGHRTMSGMAGVPAVLPKANDPCWCGSGRKFKRCHRAAGPATTRPITPGLIGPRRPVPAGIARPDYADDGEPKSRPQSLIKPPAQIERMRRAGKAAAQVLEITGAAVRPGITTD